MKIVIPDLVSNSYFPSIAAVELGFFKQEGLDVELELVFPVNKSYEWLRDGKADFVGGSAHSILAAFPEWRGAKLLGALAQGMYWFLVMRADLKAKRGDVSIVKGRKIGAAPWVDFGFKQLLKDAGIDEQRDRVEIMPVPGATGAGVSFGVNAAKALGRRQDRRLLGQRHGRGSGGAPRHRHGRARCAARRRAEGGVRLYVSRAGHDGGAGRARARTGRRRRARAGQDASGAQRQTSSLRRTSDANGFRNSRRR